MPLLTLATFVTLRSAEGVTVSASAAEQTPPVQDVEGFELVTPAGGVIETVLVTPVCACAHSAHIRRRHASRKKRTRARHEASAGNANPSARAENQFKRATSSRHFDRAGPSLFQKLLDVTKSSLIQANFGMHRQFCAQIHTFASSNVPLSPELAKRQSSGIDRPYAPHTVQRATAQSLPFDKREEIP